MLSFIRVQVRLFGAFRNLIEFGEVSLTLPSGASVSEVKDALAIELKKSSAHYDVKTLLSNSALASEIKILKDSDIILNGMKLAILPPVCGG